MQRYFTTKDHKENVILFEDDIFHIQKVLRMKNGDKFEINVDGIIHLAQITSINPLKFEIIETLDSNNELDGYIRLLYCLPKGEKTDLVIQKAVELGVKEVVLINSTRSIAKITNENKDKKLQRFNKIIKEASEQSKRNDLMKLIDVISFKDIKNYDSDISLIAYESTKEASTNLFEYLNDIKGKTVNVIVGAEGGITKEELEIAKSLNYKEISLGKRILRSETACFYILSLLSFFMEK